VIPRSGVRILPLAPGDGKYRKKVFMILRKKGEEPSLKTEALSSLFNLYQKLMKFFPCTDILSTWHFVNLAVCQLGILSTWHFVNLVFCQRGILSNWHFVNLAFCQIGILAISQPGILSSSHFVNLTFCQPGI
jgi:hypothetical protein